MNVTCDYCKKFLFQTNRTSKGAAGVEAQQRGFIYKLPVLFTNKYTSLYFCNEACCKSFYKANIPVNPKVSQALAEIRKEIPAMAEEVANKMDALFKRLNKKL